MRICQFRGARWWLGLGFLAVLLGISVSGTGTLAAVPTKTPSPNDILAQYQLPREQTLVISGAETNNPRTYDPATGSDNRLLYSGLVSFDQSMRVTPDLAECWEVDATRTIYTFHLRPKATFHSGRAFTAQDVVYSWDRAANPATRSNNVLTYLGDIVGLRERNAGTSDHISGLTIVDDHTLKVQIDAPKPYFVMKLSYGPALIVDRANVESGKDWYRTPNGTGPYKLARWKSNEVQIFERYSGFYLSPPAIRYILIKLFAGVDIRLYESDQIDISGVSSFDLDRVSDPADPLHKDLLKGVSACSSFVRLDVTQPPFDDIKVRQAFAHAINRQQYIDIVFRGHGLPAKGLYPPSLPGHNLELRGLDFDPQLAKKLLSESKYGNALPPIVLTSSGFGSGLSTGVKTLIGMWQNTLGVTIRVEKLEPDRYLDEISNGYHGQLMITGWCADYPDPENFADALFHSDRTENWGHYANPTLDALLDRASSEPNVTQRIRLYQDAEQIIVEDGAAIFLTYPLNNLLVKPYVTHYVLTPFGVSQERYLGIDSSKFKP